MSFSEPGSSKDVAAGSDDISEAEEETSSENLNKSVLDPTTDAFDPLAAIYSDNDTDSIPDPTAPMFDNVEKFVAVYEGRGRGRGRGKKTKTIELPPGEDRPQRQFTQEQMPITKKRTQKNVVTFMEKANKGPFSALKKAVEDNAKIKVHVRKLDGIRGTCVGNLIAFDKHWNLCLVDVDETYNRLRYRRPEADACEAFEELSLSDKNQRKTKDNRETVGASVIRIQKTRRNTELCKRFVPQVVLRGEHVAFIETLSSAKKS